MKLNVPYYSQYLDVKDLYWRSRACGIACLKMVMDYCGKNTPSMDEIIELSLEKNGYGPSGWIHEVLLSVARDFGLRAEREEFRSADIEQAETKLEDGIKKMIDCLKNSEPVIVSAIKKFEEKDKFHMVVLTGFETENGNIKGFYYNDPDYEEVEEGKDRFVSIEKFRQNWRRMAIFINKI